MVKTTIAACQLCPTASQLSRTWCSWVMQAENYVLRLNAEAYEEELVRRQALPANWTPMDDALNTQLFEVDSASPEVASLVQALQQTGATVVKVSLAG